MSNIHLPGSRLRRRLTGNRLLLRLALVTAAAFATQVAAAQQGQPPANSPASATARKSPRHRVKPAETPAPDPPPQPTPAPEMPNWPVNDNPNEASVTWDSHGLRIQATNSSLHQILTQVATETGAKVEGLGTDERVFGEYGPGEARDVISQLLQGSTYNVLMIGDQGSGTPRQIVLSARRSGNTPAGANRPNQDTPDEEVDQPEVEEQPPQPPLINGRPPMPLAPQGPPGGQRTPQQVLQELQQRQQQMQEQQQQQQQQPH